jgi:hypothetical protein
MGPGKILHARSKGFESQITSLFGHPEMKKVRFRMIGSLFGCVHTWYCYHCSFSCDVLRGFFRTTGITGLIWSCQPSVLKLFLPPDSLQSDMKWHILMGKTLLARA